jgi:hypothetical protein
MLRQVDAEKLQKVFSASTAKGTIAYILTGKLARPAWRPFIHA